MQGNHFDFTEEDNSNGLIEEKSKLEIDYVPEKVNYRNQQLARLQREFFSPAVKGTSTHMIFKGEPGTGKTMLVKYCIEEASQFKEFRQTETIYINCEDNSNPQAVFRKIMENLPGIEYKNGYSIDHNLDNLREKIQDGKFSSRWIIILDEADALNTSRKNRINEVLYKLSRPSSFFGNNAVRGRNLSLSILLVSNQMNITRTFKDKVESSFQYTPEVLSPYNKEELTEILYNRHEEAYSLKYLDKDAVKLIAEFVSESNNADVRTGLKVLRRIPDHIPKQFEDVPEQSNQETVVKSTINSVRSQEVLNILHSYSDDELLVLASQLACEEDKQTVKNVTRAFIEINTELMNERAEKEFEENRQFVYRRLTKFSNDGILFRELSESLKQKPTVYKLNREQEFFEDKLEDLIERRQITEDFTVDDSSSEAEEEIEKEASEKMNDLMDGY